MNAETFWEGAMDANAVQAHLEARAGVKSDSGVQACLGRDSALRRDSADQRHHPVHALGRRPGAPFIHRQWLRGGEPAGPEEQQPAADGPRGARAPAPGSREVDDSSVELILQVGTNLRPSPRSPPKPSAGSASRCWR